MIRPYKDVAEFLKENSLSIGDILCYKTKNDDSVKHVIFAGYSVMTNAICLGSEWLSLDELADRFFISLDDGQTFKYAGVIEQGPNVTFKVDSTYNAGEHSFKVTARYCDDRKNWLVLDNQDVREILVDDEYKPLGGEDNKKTGGITYKITNIDTNDFDTQISKTEIINSNELIPYGYVIHDEYYALLDNNNNPIQVQENRPLLDEKGNQRYDVKTDADGNLILDENGNIQYDETKPLYEKNRLMWTQEEETINKIMAGQNIICTVQFPNNDKIEYVIKTNEKGLAEFFIPIPKSLNMTYTVEELLTNVLAFIFEEQDEYNEAIQTKQEGFTHKTPDPNKTIVNIDYGNNFKRYKPGEVAYIPVFLSANIKIIKNHFTFYAELKDTGDSDEVTILYKVCNLNNNEGILKTTFKTNDKKLTPNSISKNIYCGLMSEIDLNVDIEKNIVELQNLNVLYINVLNQKKENKNVEVQISLERIPTKYLGNYDFIDIDIENGDYSIIEENNNLYINWLIGSMESFEKQKSIIKIQAKEIGLSNINIEVFDYLHKKDGTTINVKQSECSRCEKNNSWVVADSQWKQFDGIWYKKFSDGVYRKPTTIVLENGQYSRKWVDKV